MVASKIEKKEEEEEVVDAAPEENGKNRFIYCIV